MDITDFLHNFKLDSDEHYIQITNFTEEEIDALSKLDVNNYLFFRFLPNIGLVYKYFTNKSIQVHGVSHNTNLSLAERQQFIKMVFNNLKNSQSY